MFNLIINSNKLYTVSVTGTKKDVNNVLLEISKLYTRSHYLSVNDFNNICGNRSGVNDSIFGWYTLEGIKVKRSKLPGDIWVIEMPEIKELRLLSCCN